MLKLILAISALYAAEAFLEKPDYPFAEQLDKNGAYTLFWKSNTSHITFEVHVQTTGYIGFGISYDGTMFPSDVVIGWVDGNGVAHLTDRHANAHRQPSIDPSQDWHLLGGYEANGLTVLTFERKLDTCDDDNDRNIQRGAVHVIYSYHDTDPTSDAMVPYHGATRGNKTLILLDRNIVPDSLPADSITFDFRNKNFTIPIGDTYWCRGIRMPSSTGHQHMIKYEPVITPGNEDLVQHMVVYLCYGDVPATSDNVSGQCYGHRPHALPKCFNGFLLTWTKGGQAYSFPENVGFTVGGIGDSYYYVFEIHYRNTAPTALTPLDESGIRITLTKQLRTHEAGLLEMGHVISFYQIIPPYQNVYTTKSYCGKECIEQGLQKLHKKELHMFGIAQHTHQLGISIRTRHFRDNTELPALAYDPDTDINFQEMRRLLPEVVIQQGDSFSVECVYNSSKRTNATYGGMSNDEEMCLTFVYYYPKIDIGRCISRPSYNELGHFSAVRNLISSNGYDWHNTSVVRDFANTIDASTTAHYCYGNAISTRTEYSESAVVRQPFVPPLRHC